MGGLKFLSGPKQAKTFKLKLFWAIFGKWTAWFSWIWWEKTATRAVDFIQSFNVVVVVYFPNTGGHTIKGSVKVCLIITLVKIFQATKPPLGTLWHVKIVAWVVLLSVVCYSASSLVVPRTEEQISAPIAVKKFQWPSISGWEGPSCSPKCSKLCYDQFGVTLEAETSWRYPHDIWKLRPRHPIPPDIPHIILCVIQKELFSTITGTFSRLAEEEKLPIHHSHPFLAFLEILFN